MAQAATAVGMVEYDLGHDAFTDPVDRPHGFSELKAVVRYPLRASGTLPVVVLLGGRQLSCHSAAENGGASRPCPAGVAPYPSYADEHPHDGRARELAEELGRRRGAGRGDREVV
jgi:hypothetical protein